MEVEAMVVELVVVNWAEIVVLIGMGGKSRRLF